MQCGKTEIQRLNQPCRILLDTLSMSKFVSASFWLKFALILSNNCKPADCCSLVAKPHSSSNRGLRVISNILCKASFTSFSLFHCVSDSSLAKTESTIFKFTGEFCLPLSAFLMRHLVLFLLLAPSLPLAPLLAAFSSLVWHKSLKLRFSTTSIM